MGSLGGLSVYLASNGTFLEFRPADGPAAAIRLESVVDRLDPVVQEAVLNWCSELRTAERSSRDGIVLEGAIDIAEAGKRCQRCGQPVVMGVRRDVLFLCLSCVNGGDESSSAQLEPPVHGRRTERIHE